MLFSDEVIPPDDLEELGEDGDVQTSDRELTMAQQLIDSLSSDFEPEKYRDEYREAVLDMIERKAQGETIVIEEPAEEPKQVPDLMAALEASIASAKSPSKPKPDSKPKAKRAPAKKKAAAKS
jgi:DNA end-binding protein Ku